MKSVHKWLYGQKIKHSHQKCVENMQMLHDIYVYILNSILA